MVTGHNRWILGHSDQYFFTMKKYIHILLTMLLLAACYKDEVDVSSMKNNPFDRDFEGPEVFEFVDTYVETVTVMVVVGNPPNQTQVPMQVDQQVIEFRVHEELFLSPPSYSVQVRDLDLGSTQLLHPDPQFLDHFKYYRPTGIAEGTLICVELGLSNNQTTARLEVICATL